MKFKLSIIISALLSGLFIILYFIYMGFQTDVVLNLGVSIFYTLRNILYAAMAGMAVITVFAVVLYLLYLKRKKTLSEHFNLLENGSAKIETIDSVLALTSEIRQVTANKEIKLKLDEIEEQTEQFNLKRKAFGELFDMRDVDFRAEIESDLKLTEKNLIGNWFNMLFIIKSLEGIYSQRETSSNAVEKAGVEFQKNTKANYEMFESLNDLFVKTTGSNNKVSSSKMSVESTIEAMKSGDKLKNIDRVNDDIKF